MLRKISKLHYSYLILSLFTLSFVLLTNPFLRYPYDIFAHLIAIDELYQGATHTTTTIQQGRLLWHGIWANFFHLFHIESQALFLRAKLIYTIQTMIALLSVFYFSHVLLRNLFKKIEKQTLLYLSTWSTVIWLIVYATHSVYYHLVWNLWYSVNYQITLALFWYLTALTLVLILEKKTFIVKIFFILQIVLIARFILQVHAMEFMYYLMYIALLSLLYIQTLYHLFKKYYYLFVPILILLIYTIPHYIKESSKIFYYLHQDHFFLLYKEISRIGHIIITSLNRADSGSVNELMFFLFCISPIILLYLIFQKKKNITYINYKILIFVFISASFIFIPLTQFTAGLFGLIARPDVIHRIYYSSSLFLLLPIFSYLIVKKMSISIQYLHMIILIVLIATYTLSKYSHTTNHFFYKNIHSIQNSFNPNTYHFHLSQKNIQTIGQKLQQYEKNNHSGKKIFYYARSDIAFVIKYMYHKEVFWKGRRANPDYIKAYKEKQNNTYQNILFQTPVGFPKYIPFK